MDQGCLVDVSGGFVEICEVKVEEKYVVDERVTCDRRVLMVNCTDKNILMYLQDCSHDFRLFTPATYL